MFRPRRGCAQPDGHCEDRLQTHTGENSEHTSQHSTACRAARATPTPLRSPDSLHGLCPRPPGCRGPSLPRPQPGKCVARACTAATHVGYLLHPGGKEQIHKCSQCLACKKLLEVNTYGQLLRGAKSRADHPGGVSDGESNTSDPDACPNHARGGTGTNAWCLSGGSARRDLFGRKGSV